MCMQGSDCFQNMDDLLSLNGPHIDDLHTVLALNASPELKLTDSSCYTYIDPVLLFKLKAHRQNK